MGIVAAFGTITGTTNAGMTAYYRAPDCDSVTIADVLPILSKIDYYEDEYVIGEMLIWDTGSQSPAPNNCAMVRVIIYNDGWICAWFDKTDQNQLSASSCGFVDQDTLSGFGYGALNYANKYNGCQLKITGSSDPDCPVGTIHTIQTTDYTNGKITTVRDFYNVESYHTGYTYDVEIYMSNGNAIWTGQTVLSATIPPYNSNRLYRAIYQIWDQIKSSSNSSNWSDGNASLVYMYDYDIDTYTNETTDFNDDGANDCQVFPITEEINDAFYIGNNDKFSGVSITMGTPGVGTGVTWEYWDGSAWSTLTTTDGTSGFTSTGEITFDPPDDWVTNTIVTSVFFWIRARVTTASYTTTPLLTQGQLYDQQDLAYTDTELGIYNFEFTSANYVLLCGATVDNGDKYYYNTVLPGKTIYDDVLYISGYPYSGVYNPRVYGYYNSIYIHEHRYGYPNQSGHINIDTTGRRYSPGTQNVVRIYGYNHFSYGNAANVITVS